MILIDKLGLNILCNISSFTEKLYHLLSLFQRTQIHSTFEKPAWYSTVLFHSY